MAGDTAIGKRAKISQAQQYLLFAVLGTSMLLGVAIALIMHFTDKISFNANVIAEEDQSIKNYSDFIKGVGICQKPSGDVYTDEELNKCNPNLINTSSIPGTLRANILEGMTANAALNSVPKEDSTGTCINPDTGKDYTYKEMNNLYKDADTNEERIAASNLIKECSALRVIPDALPSSKNEEALLSSLNKIFDLSGWDFESLSPSQTSEKSSFGTNLKTLSVSLSVEANTATTVTVLDNIERSIREFNVQRASISWGRGDTLVLQAQATAFYMEPTKITDSTTTIKPGGTSTK